VLSRLLKSQIDISARLLVDFFTANAKKRVLDFPFRDTFPINCCEGASLAFHYLIEAKYGITNSYLQMGQNEQTARHIWVIVGDFYSYDLTAHQFDELGITAPIIGVMEHPLWTDHFSEPIAYRDHGHLTRRRVLNAYGKGRIPF